MSEDYAVELSPPDIAPYRAGNTGIDYVTSFAGARGGPHVMVSALVHGNEICGAIALDALLRQGLRPARGRLTLAFMNVAAYRAFDPESPRESRYVEEDLNRLWSPEVLDGARDSVELRRARALRPLVDTVDLLLDVHSMQHATAPLMLAGPLAKGRDLALALGLPELVVRDAGHAAGTRLRDYAGFGDPASPKTALLIECGQHWERAAAAVALQVTLRFLVEAGAIEAAAAAPMPNAHRPAAQRVLEVSGAVTVESDRFRFAADYRGLEVIPKAGTVIGYDGERAVATPYDDCVLVMPSRRLGKGETAVRFGRYLDAPDRR